MMVNGQPLSVGFWDTAGNEEYDRLRPLSYPMTDVFGLMFALGGEGAGASLENIQSKWLPEAKHRAPSSAPAMPKSRLEHLMSVLADPLALRLPRCHDDHDRPQVRYAERRDSCERYVPPILDQVDLGANPPQPRPWPRS